MVVFTVLPGERATLAQRSVLLKPEQDEAFPLLRVAPLKNLGGSCISSARRRLGAASSSSRCLLDPRPKPEVRA